ncbi:MAG: Adenylate kinase [Firmicutes bacterium ADurb.Bin182]|nr:MAG: Adenylate kinase [Firmicutes bacterium ADurb.Bin182]
MRDRTIKLILLGPPGAGKGTQAERISEAKGIAHISTGDMLRMNMRIETELGIAAKTYVEKGELVPDEVIIGMVKERISKPDCEDGFLLDGFPRTVAQADALSLITDIDLVINIESSEELILKRICGRRMCPACGKAFHISRHDSGVCDKCGCELYQRTDDNQETVRNRLAVYYRQTEPLIDYYRSLGKLRTLDGDRSIEEVLRDILSLVDAL